MRLFEALTEKVDNDKNYCRNAKPFQSRGVIEKTFVFIESNSDCSFKSRNSVHPTQDRSLDTGRSSNDIAEFGC